MAAHSGNIAAHLSMLTAHLNHTANTTKTKNQTKKQHKRVKIQHQSHTQNKRLVFTLILHNSHCPNRNVYSKFTLKGTNKKGDAQFIRLRLGLSNLVEPHLEQFVVIVVELPQVQVVRSYVGG